MRPAFFLMRCPFAFVALGMPFFGASGVWAQMLKLPRVGGLDVLVLEQGTGGVLPAPIARAEVCVFASAISQIQGTVSGGPVEYTDDQGWARFGGVITGPFRVVAAKPGYRGQEQHFSFPPGKPLRFALKPGQGGPACPKMPGGRLKPPGGPGGGMGGGPVVPREGVDVPLTPPLPGTKPR